MALTVCISALIGIVQSILLYFAVSSAMKSRTGSAVLYFVVKSAAYGLAAFLLLTAGKEHIIAAAVSFGVCYAVLSFVLAFVSMRKK